MSKVQEVSASAEDEVLYEVANHVATITFNAPDRMNTISGPMLNQLTQRLLDANQDRDVRDGARACFLRGS